MSATVKKLLIIGVHASDDIRFEARDGIFLPRVSMKKLSQDIPPHTSGANVLSPSASQLYPGDLSKRSVVSA